MKQRILAVLLGQAGKPVSGAKLAETLGISRVMVHKYIASLRSDGFVIKAIAGHGYELFWPKTEVNPSRLRVNIKGDFGQQLDWHLQLGSTQDALVELVNQGQGKHGQVLLAREQSGGRGRRGRYWVSAPGGIWFSLLIITEIPIYELSRLALLFSLAVVKAIKPWCSEVKIKWPNDIMIHDCKLGGLLLNLQGETNDRCNLVVGVGINVNGAPPNLLPDHKQPAISLQQWRGEFILIDDLFVAILQAMESLYCSYGQGKWDNIIAEYRTHCTHLGKIITVHQGDQLITGVNTAITQDGSLQLMVDDHIITLHSGDII
ncbi:MAG: biotin--[acetyl-CoA-carboxylase] ligase [Methylocystaceae bacterium]